MVCITMYTIHEVTEIADSSQANKHRNNGSTEMATRDLFPLINVMFNHHTASHNPSLPASSLPLSVVPRSYDNLALIKTRVNSYLLQF